MKALLDWFETKDDTDPVLRAAIAPLWLVTIHPFDNGNGRIARAIADMALARSDHSPQRLYSMSAQIRQARQRFCACVSRGTGPASSAMRGVPGRQVEAGRAGFRK
jgi:Fic family protein